MRLNASRALVAVALAACSSPAGTDAGDTSPGDVAGDGGADAFDAIDAGDVASFDAPTNDAPRDAPASDVPRGDVTDGAIVDSGADASPDAGPYVPDPSTLNGHYMVGYQGWHSTPGDGSLVNQWIHWFKNNTPTAANLHVDFWPDVSELAASELFATQLQFADGSPARVYSAYNHDTVVRHLRWMQDYGIDGAFVQRFTQDLEVNSVFDFRNTVLGHVREGAETYDRTFAVMYDLSGDATTDIVGKVEADWAYLVNTMHVTDSPRYQRHNGHPVVAIWGLGFVRSSGQPQETPAQAQALLDFFHTGAPANEQATVMGGVPAHWRNGGGDSLGAADNPSDPWSPVYLGFDVISPWTVGRYTNEAGADSYSTNYVVPDLALATSHSDAYMPVVFPGFSWCNLQSTCPGSLNQIPRNGGRLLWRQLYDDIGDGVQMIYGAMFDEVDEGTAIYKLVAAQSDLPTGASLVYLDIDGFTLPSDWYLRLTGAGGQMLRGEIARTATIPISP